jgi:hypothetical protein
VIGYLPSSLERDLERDPAIFVSHHLDLNDGGAANALQLDWRPRSSLSQTNDSISLKFDEIAAQKQ